MFHSAVDPRAPGCGDYYKKVCHPVDIAQLEQRNAHFDFKSLQSLFREFHIMFQNCMDFNQQSPVLVSYCKNVETEAMKRLEEARRRDGEMRNEYSRGMKKQCGLCGGGDLTLEGALLHCSGRCMEMIESNHPFYHDVANQYIWCENCYSQLPDTFSFEGKQWKKKELRKGSNSKKDVEAWIQCARCLGHFHRICALYNNRLAEQDPSLVFHCPKCILEMKENCITSPVALYLPRVTGTFNIVT